MLRLAGLHGHAPLVQEFAALFLGVEVVGELAFSDPSEHRSPSRHSMTAPPTGYKTTACRIAPDLHPSNQV